MGLHHHQNSSRSPSDHSVLAQFVVQLDESLLQSEFIDLWLNPSAVSNVNIESASESRRDIIRSSTCPTQVTEGSTSPSPKSTNRGLGDDGLNSRREVPLVEEETAVTTKTQPIPERNRVKFLHGDLGEGPRLKIAISRNSRRLESVRWGI
mmetsp:Transcript_72036/g.192499  ORF Transcript_72036/g.192499 Transcript_72036/m.192499 type:complete len:151 (+) Transcript_72036:289-741(+)